MWNASPQGDASLTLHVLCFRCGGTGRTVLFRLSPAACTTATRTSPRRSSSWRTRGMPTISLRTLRAWWSRTRSAAAQIRGGWAERLRSGFSGVRGNGAGAAVRLRQVGLLPRRDPARRILSTKAVGQDPDGVDCLGQHRSRCKAPG